MSRSCNCFDMHGYPRKRDVKIQFHMEEQDTQCDAWQHLLQIIDEAAQDRRTIFDPGAEMTTKEWRQIITLPPSIRKLKFVRRFVLYGCYLVRIPPEISEMTALESLDTYTSYHLHWYPYEITHCPNLKDTCVSVRALYGNGKYLPPFAQIPSISPLFTPKNCSVCRGPFTSSIQQLWLSKFVGTDLLPLLVHACSDQCINELLNAHSHAKFYKESSHIIRGKSLHEIHSNTRYYGCTFYLEERWNKWYTIKNSLFDNCSFRCYAAWKDIENCRFENCSFPSSLNCFYSPPART
ncbi:leucine-rich repeat domain-containing protein [Candidatus Uabimicrobium amorphum]|uniref:Uncharacterized protein n=1 Tax=Uabimicrobium amorphum TaxID=2596890 RepID=A0A5S9F201_UABAM|nr:leucine-rich repeat domain-containing protein [Candidatus Uabimicrobium amorphum]BBM81939.1 hypothetical protein UABAM_00282 [Candidatus Uabimicrobium amorphum]